MELQDAQKYLNSIDTLSDSDVLRLFENLNSQAFQTSARIADTVKFSLEGNEAKLQGWMEMSKASVVESVGETMMKLLEFRRHDEDPICVQIAIQCCVASFTSWLIFAWGLGYDPYLESFGKVLSLTQLPETQTVSGRWRSLAKSHLRLLVEGPSWSGDCTNALLSRIVDVLLVSGAKGPHGEALNEMRHSFGEKINSIILSSLAIRKAIGEEIISRDFEPIFIDCAGRFDMKSMDDAYASSKTDSRPGTHGKRVICTAEMGLQRVESRAAGGEVRAILLKPKVILESMIAELQKTRP